MVALGGEMRLSSRLDFGLAVIRVKLVSKAEMRDLDETEEGEEPPDGLWEPEDHAIYIQRALSNEQKRHIYFHEIIHCANDVSYWSRYG